MLKPNVGVVLVKQQKPEEVTQGGLVVVQQQEEGNHRIGEVVAVGEGCSVEVGVKVIFPRDVGQETKDGDTLLIAVLDDDLCGVVE